MSTHEIQVKAERWKLGWELTLDDGGVTQVRTLNKAVQQVRDYLDSIDPDTNHDNWNIIVVPQLGHIINDIQQAQAATLAASTAQIAAAQQMRRVVQELRAQGLSVTDTAAILGVSRGRVSQLA